MKNFFLVLGLLLFISTNVFAEYILEPANCTLKKKSDCGAYLYNNKTGATYFCNLEECKEIMPQIEDSASSGEEVKDSKKSKIPKFKKKKKSKIPKFKKKSE